MAKAKARSDTLLAALTDPGFYPDAPAAVEVRETHLSWVFLAGDRAYKLKKPVVLEFVDYRTPARRRTMCRAEVRLNQRLAPDVYLGVRGVVATPSGFELGADDDPGAVDYLVEMRRFDEHHTMRAVLERGELERSDVRTVARVLADFHAQAPRALPPDALRLVLERRFELNVHELTALVEQRAELEHILALERFVHAFLEAHAETVDARVRRGRVREGHGDLRAEHVVLVDPVQIVDCVEFDRGLRELDVADDLAFLVMDLAAHRGEHAGEALIEAYREAGGDPGDDALIAFHAVYRALVRAKVALLRAAQHPPASAAHGQESALARDLVSLAERFAWRARLPLAIVVCGVPASGKSHLAQALTAASGLPHLSSDVTRKRLAGIAPTERAPDDAYREQLNALTYAELGRRAVAEVAASGGAVVDATFRNRAHRDAFAATFANAAPLLFVECQAPAAVLARRAARRDAEPRGASDATSPVVMRERLAWDALDEVAADAHVTLRTDRPIDRVVADLLALLDRRVARAGELRIGDCPDPRTSP